MLDQGVGVEMLLMARGLPQTQSLGDKENDSIANVSLWYRCTLGRPSEVPSASGYLSFCLYI